MGNLIYRKFSSSPTYVLTHSIYMHVFSSSGCVCVCVCGRRAHHLKRPSTLPLSLSSCLSFLRSSSSSLFRRKFLWLVALCSTTHTHTAAPFEKGRSTRTASLACTHDHTTVHGFLITLQRGKKETKFINLFSFFLDLSFSFLTRGELNQKEKEREKNDFVLKDAISLLVDCWTRPANQFWVRVIEDEEKRRKK